jgi:tetratricopeptide (TPR) repeat protein
MAERSAGRIAEAQAAFTRARQLNPRDATIAYQLGMTCLDLNQLAQAEGELEAVLALQPDHFPSLLALAKVHGRRGRWEDAIALLERAIAVDHHSAEAHLELGRALMAAHRLGDAARRLEQATRLEPTSVESQLALAMCYHALDKRRHAKRALDRVTRLDPHNADAQRLLSQL